MVPELSPVESVSPFGVQGSTTAGPATSPNPDALAWGFGVVHTPFESEWPILTLQS